MKIFKSWNHEGERLLLFASCHVVDIHKPWLPWNLFHVASTSLEMRTVLSFLKDLSRILEEEVFYRMPQNCSTFD